MAAAPRRALGQVDGNGSQPSELDRLRSQLASLKQTQQACRATVIVPRSEEQEQQKEQKEQKEDQQRDRERDADTEALLDFADVEKQLADEQAQEQLEDEQAQPPVEQPPPEMQPPAQQPTPITGAAAAVGLLDAVLYSPRNYELEQHVKTSSEQAAKASKRAAKELARAQQKMRSEVESERRKLSGTAARRSSSGARRSSLSSTANPATTGKLRAELDELRAQARNWSTEKDAFRAEVEAAEKNAKRLAAALSASESKTKTAVQQKAELNKQVKLQQKALREQERKVKEMSHGAGKAGSSAAPPVDGTVYLRMQGQQRKLQELERERDEAKLKQGELSVEAEIAQTSLAAEQERHAATAEDLADAQASLASASEQLVAAEALAGERDTDAAKLADLEQRLEQDSQARLQLVTALNESQAETLRCTEALEVAEARQQTLASESAERDAASQQLQTEVEALRNRELETTTQLTDTTTKLVEAEQQLSVAVDQQHAAAVIQAGWGQHSVRQNMAAVRAAFSDTLRSSLERERMHAESRIVELESQLEEMSLVSEEHVAAIEDKSSAIHALMDQVAAAQRSVASTTDGAKECERELTRRCEQLESDLRTARATTEAEALLRTDTNSEIKELASKISTLSEKNEQLETQVVGAQALAQGQRDVATELRKLLDEAQQKSKAEVGELSQTVEELEEELVATADERDALHRRVADNSEREAANSAIAQLKKQLLASKREVQQLRASGFDKDTKIAQLRTQANAALATSAAAPSPRVDSLAGVTPGSADQRKRTWASPRASRAGLTAEMNGSATRLAASTAPASATAKSEGVGKKAGTARMGESAHIERLRRARRDTMDKDSFAKGEPLAFLNAKKRAEEQAAADEAELTALLAVEVAPAAEVVAATPDISAVQQLERAAAAARSSNSIPPRQQHAKVATQQEQQLQEADDDQADQTHQTDHDQTDQTDQPAAAAATTRRARASSPAVSKRGRSTPRATRPRVGKQQQQKKSDGGLYARLSSPGRSSLSSRRRGSTKTVSYVV
jgi:predicted  nucleic acid-binding Zn-ribbon protein